MWTGGRNNTGTWSGKTYDSRFIPSTDSKVPARGLVSFYLDVEKSGHWNRKNAISRMGAFNFFLCTYLPSIIAVGYGVLWMIVDSEVKRLEKYRQLSRSNGCKGSGSVCLNYHCFWSPLAILQALYHRQWLVVISSIAYLLSFVAVPNLQSYVLYWESYSGGMGPWGGEWPWQTFQVNHYWALVLAAVLASILVCNILIILILAYSETGLTKDPCGIADAVELVLETEKSDFGIDEAGGTETMATILRKYSRRVFIILPDRRLVMRSGQASPTTKQRKKKFLHEWRRRNSILDTFTCLIARARVLILTFGGSLGKANVILRDWASQKSYAAFVEHLPHILWNILLMFLLGANIYVLTRIGAPSQMSAQNYALPWGSDIYLLVGVFVQVR